MITRLNSAFPHCSSNSCLDNDNRTRFNIIDDPSTGRSIIYRGTSPLAYPKLTVENPNGKTIYMLAIDNCIFSSSDGKKCDCAVFDDSTFHFVEFKKAAVKSNKRSAIKNKAIVQLKETVIKFSGVLTLSEYNVKALLCVGYFNPHPCMSSNKIADVADFLLNYNVDLIEGNIINF